MQAIGTVPDVTVGLLSVLSHFPERKVTQDAHESESPALSPTRNKATTW